MANLAWFVEEALTLASILPSEWEKLPRERQIQIIQDWQTHTGTPVDFVKKTNFQTVKQIKMEPTTDKPQNLPYEQFSQLDIRVGVVLTAEPVPKSKKLIKMEVDFGEAGKRLILAGIAPTYDIPQLIGCQVVAVLNLAPRTMMGITSQGMILAAHNKEAASSPVNPVLVQAPFATAGASIG